MDSSEEFGAKPNILRGASTPKKALNSASQCSTSTPRNASPCVNPYQRSPRQLVFSHRGAQLKHRAARLQIQRPIQGQQLEHVTVQGARRRQGALVADALKAANTPATAMARPIRELRRPRQSHR